MPRIAKDVRQRILDNVVVDEATGCWVWQPRARTGSNRYGAITMPSIEKPRSGSKQPVHRVAYAYFIGDIPFNTCVLHRCDNVICANPDHLWLGTNKDNTRDMMRKGRGRGGRPIGSKNRPKPASNS